MTNRIPGQSALPSDRSVTDFLRDLRRQVAEFRRDMAAEALASEVLVELESRIENMNYILTSGALSRQPTPRDR